MSPICTVDDVDRAVARRGGGADSLGRRPRASSTSRVMFKFRQIFAPGTPRIWPDACTREHGKTLTEASGLRSARHRGRRVRLRHSQPDHGRDRWRISPATSTAKPPAIRSAFAPASRRSISPPWCRCGCFPIASPAATPSCSSRAKKCPLIGHLLGELLIEAGLPAGVFNIVHGGKDMRRCPADPSAGQRHLVRRLHPRRQVCLRDRHADTASACRPPAARRII